MKLKDIKKLKWLRGNTRIKLDGQDYTIQLQQDQDGNWIINFIKTPKDTQGSK